MSEPGCLRIPLDHYPGFNVFVGDWLRGQPRATKFLSRSSDSGFDAVRKGARRAPAPALVAALDASNRRWGLFLRDQLQRWATGQTVTLVAGQQVGFAGGPLYTIAKIASLMKMKRQIEAAGRSVTLFFWLATEDHDFEEVAQLAVPISTVGKAATSNQLDLLSIRATRSFESKSVVGRLAVPEPLITELLALYELPRPPWLREGVTFADSFAELIASVFGPDVILVDALLPELRRSGAELFERIGSRWSDIQQALKTRAGELVAAGYEPQVLPREDGDYTLLFEIDESGNRRIIDAPRSLPPEMTSTSALTRPLLQDSVLQPDVFIGGPAEVAYYAQLAPVHDLLDVRMPRVGLRGHALLAPKRMIRFVNRFAVSPDELFSSPDEVLAQREPEAVGKIRRLTAEGNRQLMKTIEQIGEIALPADHALARAIHRSVGHIEYHFNKLAERAVRGVVRKDRERWAAARELAATLRPDGHVQDRIVAWLPYWLRHERPFIERLVDEIEPDSANFKVISL